MIQAFEVLIKISQRNRNDTEILAEFQQIKQTVELEVQIRQRDSWKSLVSPGKSVQAFRNQTNQMEYMCSS